MLKPVEKEIAVFNIMETDGNWVCYAHVASLTSFALKYCTFFVLYIEAKQSLTEVKLLHVNVFIQQYTAWIFWKRKGEL